DTAGPTGYFEQSFTGLNPDTHTLRIYGVDQSGRATAPIFIEIYTPIYQETTISNIILPPTISIVDSEVTAGDDVVVLGTTVPSADMSVFTDSPLRSYVSAADSSGDWNYTITDTIDYT